MTAVRSIDSQACPLVETRTHVVNDDNVEYHEANNVLNKQVEGSK